MGKTHQTHFTVGQMPWKRVVAERQEAIVKMLDDELTVLMCKCGEVATVRLGPNHCYCTGCWDNGDDEDA